MSFMSLCKEDLFVTEVFSETVFPATAQIACLWISLDYAHSDVTELILSFYNPKAFQTFNRIIRPDHSCPVKFSCYRHSFKCIHYCGHTTIIRDIVPSPEQIMKMYYSSPPFNFLFFGKD